MSFGGIRRTRRRFASQSADPAIDLMSWMMTLTTVESMPGNGKHTVFRDTHLVQRTNSSVVYYKQNPKHFHFLTNCLGIAFLPVILYHLSMTSSNYAYFRALRKTQIFQVLTDSVMGDGDNVVDEIKRKLRGADDNAMYVVLSISGRQLAGGATGFSLHHRIFHSSTPEWDQEKERHWANPEHAAFLFSQSYWFEVWHFLVDHFSRMFTTSRFRL